MTAELGEQDGSPVLGILMKIRNTGDGLSKAMEVEPQILRHHQKVHVVLECEVIDIAFPNVPNVDAGVHRVQVLRASTASIIDAEVVTAALTDMRDRVARHQELKAGTHRLPTSDELLRQHHDGDHAAALVAGCPECDTEIRLTEEEGPFPGTAPRSRRQ